MITGDCKFVTGLGTTATAVVLQGPKIRLYGRIITSEAAGGLMSVHGTMVSSLLAVCALRVLAPQSTNTQSLVWGADYTARSFIKGQNPFIRRILAGVLP